MQWEAPAPAAGATAGASGNLPSARSSAAASSIWAPGALGLPSWFSRFFLGGAATGGGSSSALVAVPGPADSSADMNNMGPPSKLLGNALVGAAGSVYSIGQLIFFILDLLFRIIVHKGLSLLVSLSCASSCTNVSLFVSLLRIVVHKRLPFLRPCFTLPFSSAVCQHWRLLPSPWLLLAPSASVPMLCGIGTGSMPCSRRASSVLATCSRCARHKATARHSSQSFAERFFGRALRGWWLRHGGGSAASLAASFASFAEPRAPYFAMCLLAAPSRLLTARWCCGSCTTDDKWSQGNS